MKNSRGAASPALLVALLALFAVAAMFVYLHRQEVSLRDDVGKRLAEFQTFMRQNQATAQGALDLAQSLGNRVAVLEHDQSAAQAQQAAMQKLQQDMLRDRQGWKLAEIEHMLYTANDQLQLTGNVRGAILALETANQRLPRQDIPQLVRLRSAINQDLDALRSMQQPDIAALSMQLAQLAQSVSTWPLVSSASLPPPAQKKQVSEDLAKRLLSDLSEVVQIHRLHEGEPALLTPEQNQYLRDNLRLQLLSARLALLARDKAGFRQDIGSARRLVRRYFSAQDVRVASGMRTLSRMDQLNISPPVPALTATMAALQAVAPAH